MSVLSSSFAPISRAGFVAGRTKAQVAVVLAAISVAVVPLAFGAGVWSWRMVICLAVAVFGAWNVHGRSLIGLLAVNLGFGMRKTTGKTHWTVSPWSVNQVVGVIGLPDATGLRHRRHGIRQCRIPLGQGQQRGDRHSSTARIGLAVPVGRRQGRQGHGLEPGIEKLLGPA